MKTGLADEDSRQALSCQWREVWSSPASNGWPRSRFQHSCCVHGDYIYIFGGKDGTTPLKDLWRYHLGSSKWEQVTWRGGDLPHLQGHTILSYKRLIVIFGGEFSDDLSEPPLWIFNPDLLHVRKVLSEPGFQHPVGRRDHSAVVYSNTMYVYGGFIDLKGSSSELWAYTIDEERWHLISSGTAYTPGGRHGHVAVIYHDTMWICGGMCDLAVKTDTWSFSFILKKWQKVKTIGNPPLLTGQSAHVVKGHIVVLAGECHGDLKNDIWVLNFETLMWRRLETTANPYHLPPCTQHASVVVPEGSRSHAVEDIKCFSEPYLQEQHQANRQVLLQRPVSSPPVSAGVSEVPTHFQNKIVPLQKIQTQKDDQCQIFILGDSGSGDSFHGNMFSVSNNHDNQYPVLAKSRMKPQEDLQPLLRLSSKESMKGIENMVDCLQDEDREGFTSVGSHFEILGKPAGTKLSKPASTPHAISYVSCLYNRSGSHQGDCSFCTYCCQQTQSIINAGIRTPEYSTKRNTSQHAKLLRFENPPRAIMSKLCDDISLEDLESDISCFMDGVKVLNPSIYTGKICAKSEQEYIELDSFSESCLPSAEGHLQNGSSCAFNAQLQSCDIVQSDSVKDGMYRESVIDSCDKISSGSVADHSSQRVCDLVDMHRAPNQINAERESRTDKVLVTVGTQTDDKNVHISQDCRTEEDMTRYGCEGSSITPQGARCLRDDQVSAKVCSPYILVFGGRVLNRQSIQHRVAVWRCDVS